jgi:hypothetical protein
LFCYNSIQLYDNKFNKNKQTNFREFLVVARVWAGGTKATLLLLAALFAEQKTKFGGGESEGGASEQTFSPEDSQCLGWSQLLNEVRTFFEQQFLP